MKFLCAMLMLSDTLFAGESIYMFLSKPFKLYFKRSSQVFQGCLCYVQSGMSLTSQLIVVTVDNNRDYTFN